MPNIQLINISNISQTTSAQVKTYQVMFDKSLRKAKKTASNQ